MCLFQHFRTFEPSCTPPHKTQKSCQNDHRTIRFCNGLGRHPNLRFSRHSKNAFKPTFSSLWSWMRLNRHFHTCEPLRTPPHKPQKSIQKYHKTVRFCNGLGRHPNLRILRYVGTSGRLESKNSLKWTIFPSTSGTSPMPIGGQVLFDTLASNIIPFYATWAASL